MQYLYEGQGSYVFMDNETFDQVEISSDIIGDDAVFFVEGESYSVQFHEENVIGVELPKSVELKVTYAPKEVRKATASASLRPVTLENEMTIQAPVFIKEGDVVRVNTGTRAMWNAYNVGPGDVSLYYDQLYALASEAYEKREVPVSAIVVHDNQVIATAYNEKEASGDAMAHAEILAIKGPHRFWVIGD